MKITDSPAIQLLSLVWDHCGEQGTASWRIKNSAMQVALHLAIESLMRFDEDDFKVISERWDPGYWLHVENFYRVACGGQSSGAHGPNPSAVKAIERHLCRKPFLIRRSATDPVKIRIYEGLQFQWHVDMKKCVMVKATSVNPGDLIKKIAPHVVACAYKPQKQNKHGYDIGPRKIEKRFEITHSDIAEYHKAILVHAKKTQPEAITTGANP